MLDIIRKGIENKTASIILPLYKSMVQPHSVYCIQFWSPHLKKDIIQLEKMQKKATKMIKGLEHLPYEGRLQHPNGYVLHPASETVRLLYTSCWGTQAGGHCCTHILLVGFLWAAGWPLCE